MPSCHPTPAAVAHTSARTHTNTLHHVVYIIRTTFVDVRYVCRH